MLIRRGSPHRADTPVALTIGNFDGVHLGHQAMLSRLEAEARRRGIPACVMTFEPHPREFFAPDQAPTRLTSMRENLELLERFGVDRVQLVRFNFDFAKITAEDFLNRILGSTWRDRNRVRTMDLAALPLCADPEWYLYGTQSHGCRGRDRRLL